MENPSKSPLPPAELSSHREEEEEEEAEGGEEVRNDQTGKLPDDNGASVE